MRKVGRNAKSIKTNATFRYYQPTLGYTHRVQVSRFGFWLWGEVPKYISTILIHKSTLQAKSHSRLPLHLPAALSCKAALYAFCQESTVSLSPSVVLIQTVARYSCSFSSLILA